MSLAGLHNHSGCRHPGGDPDLAQHAHCSCGLGGCLRRGRSLPRMWYAVLVFSITGLGDSHAGLVTQGSAGLPHIAKG